MSAGLLGNGFGLRREVLENTPYCAGSVVEDLEYHLVLVWHGVRVAFVDDARVRGEMPSSAQDCRSQRARWECGRLRDLCRGRGVTLEPLLDLLLAPLSWHLLFLCVLMALPRDWARALGGAGMLLLLVHIGAAAWVGRLSRTHLTALLHVPFYVIWKLSLALRILPPVANKPGCAPRVKEKTREPELDVASGAGRGQGHDRGGLV
jgi:hypothetical protein